MKTIIFSFIAFFGFSSHALKPCQILTSNKQKAPELGDGLYKTLTTSTPCPQHVANLHHKLKEKGLTISSFMVGNRGRLNPKLGSFSFFEMAVDPSPHNQNNEIFFGHFTDLHDGQIVLDQIPRPGKLLIEAIAYDPQKGLYNFYELIGSSTGATWFYRGDSRDALLDNTYLYRQAPNQKKFGTRMRCSACHNSGGPIMKELSLPHNDWWQSQHPLTFGSNSLSEQVDHIVSQLSNAEKLGTFVAAGMKKLYQSPTYQQISQERSLQEIMRPLFCSSEINLASSDSRLHDHTSTFSIPAEFVLNPFLGSPILSFKKLDYQELLLKYGLKFPETEEIDADHIWLTPVISTSDLMGIENLIEHNWINQKVAIDILMVDFKKPLFSIDRCRLLSLVPDSKSLDWIDTFVATLESLNDQTALTLAQNIKNPDSFLTTHVPTLEAYVQDLEQEDALERLFITLLELRQSAYTSEISKNPLGQILEPGFRVIFPEPRSLSTF